MYVKNKHLIRSYTNSFPSVVVERAPINIDGRFTRRMKVETDNRQEFIRLTSGILH